jgi:hypothetical protein
MDTIHIPSQLPATVTRTPPLIEAVMTQSLREQGPRSRTVSAWRWVLTGRGPTPVSSTSGTGRLPDLDEISAEARYGQDASPPQWSSWPPWRYAFDRDPDRQQARRVLRWLTGAADAIPLLDLNRGRYVGARLYLARTDDQLRQVQGWALHGLHEHGDLPSNLSLSQAEHPWRWPKTWMNAAWLRGTIAYLDWILGDQAITPVTWDDAPVRQHPHADPRVIAGQREKFGVAAGRWDIEDEVSVHAYCAMQQGREGQEPAEPTRWPPPQWCEAVVQAHDWATGEDAKPPADHHGCGDYYPCPDLLRCFCEAAGHCLRSQCPACADAICNAGWQAIVDNYER